jgi:hypothetical protein
MTPRGPATLVGSKAWLVVCEEHCSHEVPPAVDAGLLEDVLQVLLHGVGRDGKALGDLRSRVALEHEPSDFLLALGQPVGGHQQRSDSDRMGGFHDYRDPPPAIGDSEAPCRTIHCPERESTLANATSPGELASSAVRSARSSP